MKVIIGAGGTCQKGFLITQKDTLNVLDRENFRRLGGPVKVFFAEHVWEHLTAEEGLLAASNCLEFLEPGGTLRIAVPDRLHPDPYYQDWVRPGGIGSEANDHKVEYDYESITAMLLKAGFSAVRLIEWWDRDGNFHRVDYDVSLGSVRRSSTSDRRNCAKPLSYTSLIVDAKKRGS